MLQTGFGFGFKSQDQKKFLHEDFLYVQYRTYILLIVVTEKLMIYIMTERVSFSLLSLSTLCFSML